ncbi:MAG: hypothetical protein ACRD43_12360, partial [Pyrinomonadaceae bacterium]
HQICESLLILDMLGGEENHGDVGSADAGATESLGERLLYRSFSGRLGRLPYARMDHRDFTIGRL